MDANGSIIWMTPTFQNMLAALLTKGAQDTLAVFTSPRGASAVVPEAAPTGDQASAEAPGSALAAELATPATAAAADGAGPDIGEQTHRSRRTASPSRPPGDRRVSDLAQLATAWTFGRRTRRRTVS